MRTPTAAGGRAVLLRVFSGSGGVSTIRPVGAVVACRVQHLGEVSVDAAFLGRCVAGVRDGVTMVGGSQGGLDGVHPCGMGGLACRRCDLTAVQVLLTALEIDLTALQIDLMRFGGDAQVGEGSRRDSAVVIGGGEPPIAPPRRSEGLRRLESPRQVVFPPGASPHAPTCA